MDRFSLLGILNFGYSIDLTSTVPGLMYATPRLAGMRASLFLE